MNLSGGDVPVPESHSAESSSGVKKCLSTVASIIVATSLLAGCAEINLLSHAIKESLPQDDEIQGEGGLYGNSGAYKIGNPYQIAGTWYRPAVDYGYDETGIASWYGPNFHGKQTANGERYDMNTLTAAHRTLPLPSIVRVTNLENGRSIIVRVNDRGPFAKGRIIDMSRLAAERLDMITKGTARVRVRILSRESRILAARLQGQTLAAGDTTRVAAAPRTKVVAESLDGSAQPAPKPVAVAAPARTTSPAPLVGVNRPLPDTVTRTVPVETDIFIQVGSFTVYDYAHRAQARVAGYGDAGISHALVNGRDYFRVRLGPVGSVDEADQLLASVVASGFPDARIVVD
jgi:rare lipoprotein A